MKILPAIAAALLCAVCVTASAQPQRPFPPNTLFGSLKMGYYPEAQINGKDVRFTPGARIIDQNNTATMPGTLSGMVLIRYRLDQAGQVTDAWILTADEITQARSERR
jgi:hypothetical protein